MQQDWRAAPAQDVDVVLAADFTQGGDLAYRLAEEARALAGAGLRLGLAQHRTPPQGRAIAPEIRTLERRGLAQVLDPGRAVLARRLILHRPALADWSLPGLQPLGLAQVDLVCHAAADLAARVPGFRKTVAWRRLASNGLILAGRVAPPGPLGRWLPPLGPETATALTARDARARPLVAWLGPRPKGLALPEAADHLTLFAPGPAGAGGSGAGGSGADAPGPPTLDRLVRALDLLVLPEGLAPEDLPDMLVASLLAAGRGVLAPRALARHYGAGPRYFPAGGLGPALAAALTPAKPARRRAAAAEPAFPAACRAAAARLTAPAAPARRPPPRLAPPPRPVMFVPSNGVGVGHLTRLLAVARRIEGPVIFASHAAALNVIADFGFAAEYLPSSALVGGAFDAWDSWFRHDLEGLVDRYDPSLVVYDGNHPSPGLIGAMASRRDCRLAWVRRAMWGHTTSPHLARARWCDLILEPGELAGAEDRGATARLRHQAHLVAPVRLLDEGELLSRAEAARAIGIDPGRPAVLVQLGSGYNRDLVSIIDQIVATLNAQGGLQIVLAEWVSGTIPLALWPGVRVIRGFPISQYLRAFDFCISAAGYNSYHELLAFGVPTIFIANRHPTMDDQYGRARHAQAAQAAFEIGEDELAELGEVVAMMMQKPARDFLAARCAGLAAENGALQAARALAALAAPAQGGAFP